MNNEQKEIDKIKMYKRMFNTDEGQVILRDLLRSCNFFTSTFNSDHPSQCYEEGRRSVIMELLRILQIDVEELMIHYKKIEQEDKQYGSFN